MPPWYDDLDLFGQDFLDASSGRFFPSLPVLRAADTWFFSLTSLSLASKSSPNRRSCEVPSGCFVRPCNSKGRTGLKRSLRNWSVTLNALVIRTVASMHLARAWFRSIGLPPCFALYISPVKLIRGGGGHGLRYGALYALEFYIPTSYVADLLLFNTKDLLIYCPDLNWDIGRV